MPILERNRVPGSGTPAPSAVMADVKDGEVKRDGVSPTRIGRAEPPKSKRTLWISVSVPFVVTWTVGLFRFSVLRSVIRGKLQVAVATLPGCDCRYESMESVTPPSSPRLTPASVSR